MAATDTTIPDEQWWFSDYAEFEDFVGIGTERTKALAAHLRGRVSHYVINRLLRANGLPHGSTNAAEAPDGRRGPPAPGKTEEEAT